MRGWKPQEPWKTADDVWDLVGEFWLDADLIADEAAGRKAIPATEPAAEPEGPERRHGAFFSGPGGTHILRCTSRGDAMRKPYLTSRGCSGGRPTALSSSNSLPCSIEKTSMF